MSASFKIRRKSQSSLHMTTTTKIQTNLIIDPPKIQFDVKQQNTLSIAKITITNPENKQVSYQVKPPKQRYFKLQCNKYMLNAGESVQMFLFFNVEYFSNKPDDQIVITAQNTIYVIPILIVKGQFKLGHRRIRRQSKNKQNSNANVLKLQKVRTLRQDKRKDGMMYGSGYKNKGGEILQLQDNSLKGKIQRFLQEFQRIQVFLKDKTIKNQIYSGEKPLSKQRYFSILQFNLNIEMMTKQWMKDKILSREKSSNTKEGPSVRVFQNIRLQWNKNKNQPKITYKKGVQKLLKQVRNIVIHHRFRKMNKIMTFYKNLRQQENIQQPQTKIINNNGKFQINYEQQNQQQWSESDNSDREYKQQLEQKKKHDYYCQKISKMITNKKQHNLGADFSQFSLSAKLLPLDYQQIQQKRTHTFQIKPRIGFDNWVALQQSIAYNHQLMGYSKKQRIPEWDCHPKLQNIGNFNHENQLQNLQKCQQIDQDYQITHRSNLSHLHQQYSQTHFAQSYKYKNYLPKQSQIQSILSTQLSLCEMDAMHPPKINMKQLQQIKMAKNYYLPICDYPLPSLISPLLKQTSNLIHQVKRQEHVDFDETDELTNRKLAFLQSYDQQSSSTISDRSIPNRQDTIQQRGVIMQNFEGREQETTQKMYENILKNIKKTQSRKYQIAHGRIASVNSFIKRAQNKVYF